MVILMQLICRHHEMYTCVGYGSCVNNAHTRSPVLLHTLPREITLTSYAISNLLSNCMATQLSYLEEKEDHKEQMTDSKFFHNEGML